MLRTALGLGVVAILLTATGCRMCCHPYDYCGPVYHDGGCRSCSSSGAREGSILSGTPQLPPASSGQQVRRQVQGQTVSRASIQKEIQGERRPTDVPGSEQIVSVTDRVVEPSTTSSESSEVVSDSPAETSKPLPSKGWTARRPTPDVLR